MYLLVEQVQLVQPSSAPGGVFAAGQRHRVVVAGIPGSADPAGVIVHTAALQLHTHGNKITFVISISEHLGMYTLLQ